MPSFCAVSNCEQKYSHSENVSFHKFPLKNPKILTEWIKFTNRDANWKPSRWNSICSRHFDKTDFREYLSRKCLKKDAIPSINTKSNVSYETYHISSGSLEDARTIQSDHDDYGVPPTDGSKTHSEMGETCRLCGDRNDSLTCNPVRSLNEPETELLFRKCLPALNIHSYMDHSRVICADCFAQLRQFSNFIDKVLSYQRELSFVPNENHLVNGNTSRCCIKSSTPNPSTVLFIKQEPVNVKQEKVDNFNRRPFTTQIPTISPSLCLNPFADSKKIKGLVQQEANLPKTEAGTSYCPACDRIFGNNFEFRSHKCAFAEQNMDREQGNNCEIMEVITLNNPVSFIDLAEDENVTAMEPRKLKTEGCSDFERRERLEFEHAYAKRATSASCNLKQEIIDPNNDASQNGYEFNEQFTDNDEYSYNQSAYVEEPLQIYFECPRCNQSFVSQELLDEHSANLHPLKLKICSICNAEFKSSFEYLIHKSKMHAYRFQCKQCKQKFNTPSILRYHERFCTRESKDFCFSCRHCGKRIRNLLIMKKHLSICIGKQTVPTNEAQIPSRRQGNPVRKYTCDICNRTFSRFKLFKYHKEMHENLSGAPEKTKTPNDISDAVDTKLLNLNCISNGDDDVKQSFKFVVDDSKFIFMNESKVMPLSQPSEPSLSVNFNGKFACDTCGQPFSSFAQLKHHKREHDSERKFSCSLCPKTFKGLSGLKQHISGYHYKIKPYSCPVCKYSYALRGDMQRCRHSKLKINKIIA